MIVEVGVTVDRPVAEVFDAMADARNETRWNSHVSKTELVSDPPIGKGTLFDTVNRGQPYSAEITEYDRPSRLAFDVTGRQLSILGTVDFAASADGTRVTGHFAFTPHGPMRMLMPMMGPLIRRDFPRQMDSFKRFCESRG